MKITLPPTSHTSLTGVTADQHHAKLHSIVDAAAHSGGITGDMLYASAANTWTTLANAGASSKGLVMQSNNVPLWVFRGYANKQNTDQSVNNSTTYVSKTGAITAGIINRAYFIFYVVNISAQVAGAGIKFKLSIPAASSFDLSIVGYSNNGAALLPKQSSGTELIMADTGATLYTILLAATVGCGASGNIILQWAQAAAVVGDTTISGQSWQMVSESE